MRDGDVLEDLTPRETEVLALVEAGASRFEIARALEIAPAIAKTHLDSIYLKAGVGGRVQLERHGFTTGQLQVLRLVLEGHTNGTIAQRLYLSPDAVRERLQGVYKHLGVRNRYEAIAALTSEPHG